MKAEKWFRERLDEFQDDLEFRTEEAILAFTEKVVAVMRERGMNRVALAQQLGVSKAFVTKLLNGNPNLTIKTMVAIADALECNLSVDIMPWTETTRVRKSDVKQKSGIALCHEPTETYGKG
jgi:DNA-binding Xre family transcriptional regulator